MSAHKTVPTKKTRNRKERNRSPGEARNLLLAEAQVFGIPEEDLTGGMLIMGRDDEQMQAACSTAGLSLATAADGSSAYLGHLKVLVVAPEDVPELLAVAASVSDTGVIMRPERYLYAMTDLEIPADVPASLLQSAVEPDLLAYLKGYRDACAHLYEMVRGGYREIPSAVMDTTVAVAEWNLDTTGVLRSSATGKGIRIAILDTGIDRNHQDFTSGRIASAISMIDGELVDDVHGHGTHCAGTAAGPRMPNRPPRYGAAFEAELLIGKVLSDAGRSEERSVLNGLNWAIENGATIISMSLGSRVSPGAPADPVFEEIAKEAMESGILIIAAAGNDSRRDLGLIRPVSHPANCPSIMAVASVGQKLRVSAFSNGGLNTFGGGVDIAAPGEGILSSIPSRQGLYGRKSGTSMATPLVAGIAAMYAQGDTQLRGRPLWDCLIRNCVALQDASDAVGAGLVQAPR